MSGNWIPDLFDQWSIRKLPGGCINTQKNPFLIFFIIIISITPFSIPTFYSPCPMYTGKHLRCMVVPLWIDLSLILQVLNISLTFRSILFLRNTEERVKNKSEVKNTPKYNWQRFDCLLFICPSHSYTAESWPPNFGDSWWGQTLWFLRFLSVQQLLRKLTQFFKIYLILEAVVLTLQILRQLTKSVPGLLAAMLCNFCLLWCSW